METFGQHPPKRAAQVPFACRAIDQAMDRYRPRRTLLLTTAPASLPGLGAYPLSSLFTVYCGPAADELAGHAGPPRSLACGLETLPFQSDSFDLVVAHQLLCDGDEALVAEIRRVLQGGAHLLIVGDGHWGSRNLWRNNPEQPAIRPFRICRRLRERSFVVESCAGFGLARSSVNSGNGLSRPLVALSDQVMVRARVCKRRPLVARMRFGQRATVHAGLQGISAARVACQDEDPVHEAVA